ncbi:hypothetical protein BKA70DRAFT_1217862 [Coprinopsis sp. MPI-PUGE-AT-0042]|nr:hypothetical protein BKA70DRAFT_1217862 [Coprinopsis sp. MPI-PUGE-AT-0042]
MAKNKGKARGSGRKRTSRAQAPTLTNANFFTPLDISSANEAHQQPSIGTQGGSNTNPGKPQGARDDEESGLTKDGTDTALSYAQAVIGAQQGAQGGLSSDPGLTGDGTDASLSYAQVAIGAKRQTSQLETPAESPHPKKKPHNEPTLVAGPSTEAVPSSTEGGGFPFADYDSDSDERGTVQDEAETVQTEKHTLETTTMDVDDIDYDSFFDSDALEYTDNEGETNGTPAPPSPAVQAATTPVATIGRTTASNPMSHFGSPISKLPSGRIPRISKPATPKPFGWTAPSTFTDTPNPFVDIDDGPLSLHPNGGGTGKREGIVYYEGKLPPHQIDLNDIMESVPEETREAWDAIPTNKVLAVFGRDRVTTNNFARIEELRHEVQRCTGMVEDAEILYIKMHPTDFKLTSRDTFLPMLIHDLTPRQKEALTKKRMSNSNRAWIMFFDYNLPIRNLLLSIAKLPIRNDERGTARVVKGIRESMEAHKEEMVNYIRLHSNRFPPGFSKDPYRRYKAWIRTIAAQGLMTKVEKDAEEIVWYIYMDPPHDDYTAHKEMVDTLKSYTYVIEGNKYYAWDDNYRCQACRGRDHMVGLCPFTALPGFFDVKFGQDPGTKDRKEPQTKSNTPLEPNKPHPQYQNASQGPSSRPSPAKIPNSSNIPTRGGEQEWIRGGRGGRGGMRGGRGGRGRGN